MFKRTSPTRKAITPIGGFFALLVGLFGALIILSIYRIEEHAFAALLGQVGQIILVPGLSYTLAQGLAAGLSGAKLTLPFIVVQETALSGGFALRTRALRVLVVGLALMMTLVIFGGATISPYTQARVNDEVAALKAERDGKLAAMTTRYDAEAKRIADQMDAQIASITDLATQRLTGLQAQLDVERNIGGAAYKGPHWHEIEDQIAQQTTYRDTRIAALQDDERSQMQKLSEAKTKEQADLDAANDTALKGIDRAAIASSPEAQHPLIMTTVTIAQKVIPGLADPVLITISLSLLISIVFELLPMTLLGHAYQTFTLREVKEPGQAGVEEVTSAHPRDPIREDLPTTADLPVPANNANAPAEPGRIA